MFNDRKFAIIVFAAAAAGVVTLHGRQHPSSYNYDDPLLIRFYQDCLERKGYSGHTIDELMQVLEKESPESVVRVCAMHLLTVKLRGKAIPILQRDIARAPSRQDRQLLARLLRYVGDDSGLAYLQKDYAALMRAISAAEANLADLEEAKREKANRDIRYWTNEALDVAKVMAEFGERSGFDLAAKVALDPNAQAYMRISAYEVLFEISRDDPIVLAKEGRDPGPILIKAAEEEADERAMRYLVKGARLYDRQGTRRQLLERLLASPYVTGSLKEEVEIGLRSLDQEQERAKRKRQVVPDPNSGTNQ